MRLLDLFCGAGGASMGYHQAGFEIVGVDIKPQPRYPFEFVQADALDYPLDGFDVVHASPPCQRYSRSTPKKNRQNHVELLVPIRSKLSQSTKLYIIENVPGAPLINYFILCGSMFGLKVMRHRLFESSHYILTPNCDHSTYKEKKYLPLCYQSRQLERLSGVVGVYGSLSYKDELKLRQEAMGINWMGNKELTQAIPPVYTKFIGEKLIEIINKIL